MPNEFINIIFVFISFLGKYFHLLGRNHGGEQIEIKLIWVIVIDGLADIFLSGNRNGNIKTCLELDLVNGGIVQWIGHGQPQTSTRLLVRKEELPVCLLSRNSLDYLFGEFQLFQLDVRDIELFGQSLANILVLGPFVLYDNLPQLLSLLFFLLF